MSEDAPQVPPPYVIRTERLTLRCWEPRDAPLIGEALDSSLEHLRPWMPWAHDEPTPLDERIDRLRRFRGSSTSATTSSTGSSRATRPRWSADQASTRGSGRGLSRSATGCARRASARGLAREATAALTYVAFRVCEVDRVEIRIDPGNERSLAVPRALGFVEEGTFRRRLPAGTDGVPRDMVLFTVFRDDFEGLELSRTTLEAFDALGRRLLV